MPILNLSVEIPSENVADAKLGFLATLPNELKDTEGDPLYTDKEWIEVCIKKYIRRIYKKGKNIIANNAAIVNIDIFVQ